MTHAVETLERTCKENGTAIPDLDAPLTPASEAFRQHPEAAEAAKIIAATAHHMSAIVTPPTSEIFKFVGGVSQYASRDDVY